MIPLIGGAVVLAVQTLNVVGLGTAAGIGYAYGKRAGKAICTLSDRVEGAVIEAIKS